MDDRPHNAEMERATDASDAQRSASAAIAPVVRELRRLRSSSRRRLLVSAVGLVLAVYIIGAVLVGGTDYALRLPAWLRVGFWVVGLATLIMVIRKWWIPAWRFRPSLTDVALRLEQTDDAKKAGLSGVLASGIELAARAHEEGVTGTLSEEVALDAARRLALIRPKAALLRNGGVRVSLAALALSLVPVGILGALSPALFFIGTQRVLLPWAGASWPKRTAIADITRLDAHPLGAALPLRALLTKTQRSVGQTDVSVKYRLEVNGSGGLVRSMLLTSQGARNPAQGQQAIAAETGELFERLFEPSALLAAGASRDAELIYWFETSDDRTEERRILLVEPPAIRSASVVVEPPAYAVGKLREGAAFVQGTRDAGHGVDQRSMVGPILAGSRVKLSLELNKPLAGPADNRPESLAAFVAAATPGLVGAKGLTGSFAPAAWTFEWTLESSRQVGVNLVDEHKIRAVDDAIFRFEATADRAPTVLVVDPAQDETVLPTAVIPAAAEARDDVALSSVELWTQRAERDPTSIGSAAESKGAPERAAVGAEVPTPGEPARATTELSLSGMELKPGDELWLTGVAVDVFASEGKSREPVVSPVRRLRIISETEFVEQVRHDLGALRDSAVRLQKEQARLAGARQAAATDADEAARQSPQQDAVRERLGPMDDSIERLAKRLERNRLDDDSLAGVLKDAGELLDQAAQSASEAKRALDELKRPPATQEERDREAQALADAQQQVDESLNELAQMLDSGKDSWAVRRQLEKLLTEQRQVSAQTKAAGEQTRGKAENELSSKEREDLERLATKQRELAQQAAATIESLRQRAEQMQQADPGQSESMKQAAQRALQQQLENSQREAAKKVQENKTGEAEQEQKKAEETIEEMLEDLDDVQQKRDEALQRELAEVIESLQQLIERQTTELASLGAAVIAGSDAIQKLDQGMISLRRDTLAVEDRVEEQMPDAGYLRELIVAAGEAQSVAVSALRATPSDAAEADEQERTSLSRLNEALAEAQRLADAAEDREQGRKRAMLLKKYREALEQQAVLNGETKPLVGATLTRKDRGTARALGTRQLELRESLATLRRETTELSEAKVFDAALTRLDVAMSGAGSSLAQGEAPASVGRQQQTSVDVLRAIVDALKDAQQDDEFRQAGESGGGGGGSGGGQPQGLLPPVAQLKLLRGMQAEAAGRTRAAAEGQDDLGEVSRLQSELERLGREVLEELKGGDGPEPDVNPQPPAPPTPPSAPGVQGSAEGTNADKEGA
jgi:hypothetical protein